MQPEGDIGFVLRPDSSVAAPWVPLHRYWNAKLGDHMYVVDKDDEHATLTGLDYVYEGVACFVIVEPLVVLRS